MPTDHPFIALALSALFMTVFAAIGCRLAARAEARMHGVRPTPPHEAFASEENPFHDPKEAGE